MKEEAKGKAPLSEARLAQVVDLAEWRRETETVGHLRKLLTDAEAGKLTGLLIAAHYSDGDMVYIGSGSLCQTPVLGVAAAQHLLNKMLA